MQSKTRKVWDLEPISTYCHQITAKQCSHFPHLSVPSSSCKRSGNPYSCITQPGNDWFRCFPFFLNGRTAYLMPSVNPSCLVLLDGNLICLFRSKTTFPALWAITFTTSLPFYYLRLVHIRMYPFPSMLAMHPLSPINAITVNYQIW